VEALIALRSIRSFRPDAVPEDLVRSILEVGRHTPSAHNIQPWHFIVVSDPDAKGRLARGRARFIEDAAFAIVGCGDPTASSNGHAREVAMAMQSMVLAAWLQGIGSCWVEVDPDDAELKALLNLPAPWKATALVVFGYPAEIPKPVWKKPLDEIVHYNRF
jgi:nitroreductase